MTFDRSTCLFCGIADKKVKTFVVYEDEYVCAFLDNYPRVEGHTLVIPKVHSETLLELLDEAIGPLFDGVKKVSDILLKTFNTRILTIGINHGEEKGLPHLHIHILPRFPEDGGGVIQSIVHTVNQKSIEEVYKRISKTIQK